MRRIGAGVVVVVAFVWPLPTAFADERAGDSHGLKEPCFERDRVLGHRSCPPYGEWARDELYAAVTFGFAVRHLPRDSGAGNAAAARSTTPGAMEPAGDSSTNYVVTEQIAIAPTRSSLIGFEIEIALPTDDEIAPGQRQLAAASHLVGGLHGGTQTLRFGAEIAGGIRLVDGERDQSQEGVLEARARVQLWLTPWVTVGVLGGTSLLDRGDWVAGVSLATHSFGYGGP